MSEKTGMFQRQLVQYCLHHWKSRWPYKAITESQPYFHICKGWKINGLCQPQIFQKYNEISKEKEEEGEGGEGLFQVQIALRVLTSLQHTEWSLLNLVSGGKL